MSAIQNKGHITIDGYLFMLARMPRADRHIYGREEAPTFVNKFSSGDPNYRDATFFPHWVQNNWLNGFDQEKFNDGGRFYRSSGIDPTKQEKITLAKNFSSAGQTVSGVNVLTQVAWRASATSYFGDGSDGTLTISSNTTDVTTNDFATCTGTIGSTTLSATQATFAAGQHIFIHQSRGTGAGSWMKTKIASYSAGTVTTVDPLNATYSAGAQVYRLKTYTAVTINSSITWTAAPWSKATLMGGILGFLCTGTATITGTMSANTQGFIGGDTVTSGSTGYQGEGSAGAGSLSTAANGNGGGSGGNFQNAPGGGGGNGAAGTSGFGGGTGGSAVGSASLATMFFGGGGGAFGSYGGHSAGQVGGDGGGILLPWAKTLTVTGGIQSNGGAGSNINTGSDNLGAGGGAGGSIYIKSQTPTLGTTLVTATGGAGGTGSDANHSGGAGAVGRIHIDYITAPSGTTSPTYDGASDSTLADTPTGSSFTQYVGTSNGKIYSWDGASTYTEAFNANSLTWFDTTSVQDANGIVGDEGGTEKAKSQGFTIAGSGTVTVATARVYIKKNAGTPGDITVRVETDSSAVPSGTLANANATATIPAFSTTSYGWVTITFAAPFSLTLGTLYHLVLKTAAAANDTNYAWGGDASSPTYSAGASSASTDGGTTWAAATGTDYLFTIYGGTVSVNTIVVSDITGTNKLYAGVGSFTSTTVGDGRIYSFDGTTWALVKIFNSTSETSVYSMAEFGSTTRRMYIGIGAKAKIYSTTDFSTFTLSKTITVPDNPGYVFALKEYNRRLYAAGGYPELISSVAGQYSGFLYSYDEFTWEKVGSFEHTVIKSLEVYDNLLFIGTIKKAFYVYNTASVDKLFEFPWDVQVTSMFKWDDKLALAIAPTPGSSASGYEGIYLFDRNGFHNAFTTSSRSWYSVFVFNNNLMGGNDDGYVYQTANATYQSSGTLQTSYHEAGLPNVDKKFRDLIVVHEALPTGCSITVEYKTDESDAAWTSLGSSSTVGATSATLTFPVGFYAKKISLRITLATSVPGSTPTLKVTDMRYVLMPDFKYLWKMKLACPDNLVWLDGTEPITTTTATNSANATSLTVTSTSGFPTQGRAVLVDSGTEDEFTWTGKTSTTLTGIPSSGSLALSAHSGTGNTVKMTGRTMHNTILALKQAKTLYTFVDIDSSSYTTLFHQYQADDFVVNQDDGIENNVPITLLEG